MNIARLQYNEKYQALEIYISGCDGACEGCHNPDIWDETTGNPWMTYGKEFRRYLSTDMVKYIWVLGGEPLLSNLYSLEFLLWCLYHYKKSIMLWTRFHEIPDNIKQYLSYAKIGEYQKNSEPYEEPLFGITLASKNQKIIKIS